MELSVEDNSWQSEKVAMCFREKVQQLPPLLFDQIDRPLSCLLQARRLEDQASHHIRVAVAGRAAVLEITALVLLGGARNAHGAAAVRHTVREPSKSLHTSVQYLSSITRLPQWL